jgi:hypothetical protein
LYKQSCRIVESSPSAEFVSILILFYDNATIKLFYL